MDAMGNNGECFAENLDLRTRHAIGDLGSMAGLFGCLFFCSHDGFQKNLRKFQLHFWRDSASNPVLDSLNPAVFFQRQKGCNFRWATEVINQFCVIHGSY